MLKEIFRVILHKKSAVVLLLLVLVCIVAAVGLVIYSQSSSHKQSRIKNDINAGASFSDSSNYAAAAQKYVQAYYIADTSATKAGFANQAAHAYEYTLNYKVASQWYKTALQLYNKTHDSTDAGDVQDSISRVAYYQQTVGKPQVQKASVGDGGN
jgi:flagellar basal body-associated protein FliL